MANKKTASAKTAEESAAPAAETQSSQVENSQKSAAPEAPQVEPEAPQGGNDEAPATGGESGQENKEEPKLFGLDELSIEFRTPGWQQAALTRLMGWEPGKKVSVAEYKSALDQLNNRRQGGGRR